MRFHHGHVDAPTIRAIGAELAAFSNRASVLMEELNQTYARLCEQCEHADPATDAGKAVESYVISLARISSRLAVGTLLAQQAEVMQTYGICRANDPQPDIDRAYAAQLTRIK